MNIFTNIFIFKYYLNSLEFRMKVWYIIIDTEFAAISRIII